MMKDILQSRRKLKNPQIRIWGRDKKSGEDFYRSYSGTKTNLTKLTNSKILAKIKKDKEFESINVAYKGNEYKPAEFLKKFPKYKLKRLK